MTAASDYERVERAIAFIMQTSPKQPSLSEVAEHVGLSEFHFQRLFTRWAGITPKRFAMYLSVEHAKVMLSRARGLLETSYGAGLSGPGRLHDLFVNIEAMTPAEYRNSGHGLEIVYGVHPSPFGDVLIATTARGICAVHFISGGQTNGLKPVLEEVRRQWSSASLRLDPDATELYASQIFDAEARNTGAPLTVLLKGTNFQVNVWRALVRIPLGAAVTYETLAHMAGTPAAVRAVGTAVGQNHLAYLIPCHRVIRKTGAFGNYGAGVQRKQAILAWESAKAAPPG